MSRKAQIVGKVEYRVGDGPNMTIRPGWVKIDTAVDDVTLSWVDEDDTHGATAIPLVDFKRHVAEGRIRLEA